MNNSEALARQEADAQLSVAVEWLGLTRDFSITTDEEQEQIVKLLADVKARYRMIEDKRKEFTAPLNAVVKALNAFFAPPKDRFEELEKLLKSKIAAYLEHKAASNVAALQAAAAASTATQAQEMLATVAPVETPKGISVRYAWRFEVTAPGLVPREFCSPDPDKIKAHIAASSGEPVLPGVRFSKEPIVTSRAR